MKDKIIADLFCARTIFAFMFYATFCYLVAKGKIPAESIYNVVLMLLAYYFGKQKGQNNNGQGHNNRPTEKSTN